MLSALGRFATPKSLRVAVASAGGAVALNTVAVLPWPIEARIWLGDKIAPLLDYLQDGPNSVAAEGADHLRSSPPQEQVLARQWITTV